MIRTFSNHLLPFLMLFFLLAACSPAIGPDNQGTASTPTTASENTPTSGPSAADICPVALKNVPGCFTPHALRVAYGVESLVEHGFTGKGQTVIDIVSFGSPTLQQDMDVFDRQFGLPPVNLKIISPLNKPVYDPNGDKAGWAGETTIDVQIIHAIAPDAAIVVLTSPVAETEGTIGLPEFRQLIQYAVDNKLGSVISQSWGASELTLQDQAGQQEIQQWDTLLHQITTQNGVTVFSSSGDSGATDKIDLQGKKYATVPTTSFACDDPWVTAVGGTTLTRTAGLTETVWNNEYGASGGGFSRFYKTPDYQKTLPASVQNELQNRRGVPDVSGLADPTTGLASSMAGGWSLAGGTSAAAPLWAGMMAIADQMAGHPLGFINPTLYKLASNPTTYARDFRDITSGDNSYKPANVVGYPAAPGWDADTGLGSPIADKLIPDMVAAMK